MAGTALVLFSGGKDSFLTACRLVETGNKVVLLSLNNSAVIGERNLLHGVARLQNHYGRNRIEYAGVYNTGAVISRLNKAWMEMPQRELAEAYPEMVGAQALCLHCQSAMWVAAIAYAKAHKITAIASGYRATDLFCTGRKWFVKDMEAIAKKHGISVSFPLWDVDWDTPEDKWGTERDNEMSRRGFLPRVYEPKCMLGRPVKEMSESESSDMHRYFREHILQQMDGLVDYLYPVFQSIRLSEESMDVMEYPMPKPGREC